MMYRGIPLVSLALTCAAQPATAAALLHDTPFKPPMAQANTATKSDQPGAKTGLRGGKTAGVASGGLVLKSILLAGPNSAVFINDRMLRIGEAIDGYRLVSVGNANAVLVRDGQQLILELGNLK